jgi:hypothetical protein
MSTLLQPSMLVDGTTAMIGSDRCIGGATGAPTAASSKNYVTSVASLLGMSAGSYLAGASPMASLGFGLVASNLFPGAKVRDLYFFTSLHKQSI